MCFSEWQYSKDFENDSLCENIPIADVDAFEPKTDSFQLVVNIVEKNYIGIQVDPATFLVLGTTIMGLFWSDLDFNSFTGTCRFA